ncbi:hypothetical protein ADJ70_03390 [Olsenella sp. oral taxon 807]|uniref:hypothetical protein n=1 Tax=Olsenella sp. oral taxon 807 TaxID=712411 RepID=UPI00067A0377|nr:hypothetical protein [Olsenella sp. oral taxon 807]AKT48225.1 hypothetical protein ADJ70_03390 [Olsenella sp. oral taxon 807]
MARVTTLEPLLWPLMEGPSVDAGRCVVCGAAWPLNRHHVVRRGAGRLWRDGREVPKPTLTLCGMGNASGCHALAHANRLHFRWVGRWEWVLLDEPTKYHVALSMDGWRPIDVGG